MPVLFQCDTCTQGFTTNRALATHKRMKHIVKLTPTPTSKIKDDKLTDRKRKTSSFDCDKCDEQFTNRNSLKEHKNMMHIPITQESSSPPSKKEKYSESMVPELVVPGADVKEQECDICSKTFTDDTSLEAHTKMHHKFREDIPLTPGIALIKSRILNNKPIQEKDALTKVLEDEIKNLKSTLETQNVNIITEVKIRKKALLEKEWMENEMEKCISATISLQRHVARLQTQIITLKKTCNQCSDSSINKESPQNHMQKKHDKDSVPVNLCDQCSSNFLSKDALVEHINSEHIQEVSMETDTPTVEVSTPTFLRPMCNLCGYTRNTQTQMDRHMKRHEGEEEDSDHTCQHCSFQCMNRDQLKLHIEVTHTPVKSCNNCNMTFTTRTDLYDHIGAHHKSFKPCRKFANDNCEFDEDCRFYHVKLAENQHICFKCGTLCSSKTLLLKHIKETHGGEPCKRFKEGSCPFRTRCLFSHTHTIAPCVTSSPAKVGPQTPPPNTQQEYPTLPAPSVTSPPIGSGSENPHTNSLRDPPRPPAPNVAKSPTEAGSETPHTNSPQDFQMFPTTGNNTLMVGGEQNSMAMTQQEILSMKHTMALMLAQLDRVIRQMTPQ